MNPVEIYKELPKTNCGECGQKTCMAFAVAVSKGDEIIQACPYLDEETVTFLSKSVKKMDVKEIIYENLKEEVKKINFMDVAEGIGAEVADEGIRINSLGKDFFINKDGEVVADGKVSIWARILMLLYIKAGGKGELSKKWVSLEELKGGGIKIEALKKECEAPLSELLEKDYDSIVKIIKMLGSQELEGQGADHSWSLFLLPKVPVLILYWRADEEFPQRVKILFDSSADRFLDAESLVFLCEGFLHVIEHMIGSRDFA